MRHEERWRPEVSGGEARLVSRSWPPARERYSRSGSVRVLAAMGLEPGDLAGAVPGHDGEQLAVTVDDSQEASLGSMVTMRPAWGKPTWMRWWATRMPPAGHLALDHQARGWQRLRARPSRTPCELVPLAGRNGARQGAPQDAVLGDDVHDLAVQADAGTLPGQRGAHRDDLVGERQAAVDVVLRPASTVTQSLD